MEDNTLEKSRSEDNNVQSDANLTDVIEVIETDPDFRETLKNKMFNGGGEIPVNPQPPSSSSQAKRKAHIRIIEQPASKALRFRYECEGRSAGSIPGASSTSENKTFPTIHIAGYQGRAVVVVSCVTKDPPHKPHPHNLVGREGCKKGVCTLEIPTETMTVQFSNLGIQCVKKKDIEQALKIREEIRVDPFRTGFSHRSQPTTIDLNAVRLCFQVFLEGSTPGSFSIPLNPVVSEPIYDKKAMSDLSIFKLSHCSSYVDGGKNDIILLCEKVAKEDIQVRFYEENGDWEGFADFQPTQVYKQHAIWFKPPKYKSLDITEPVKVFIQLRRPSDGAMSEPLPFEMLPLDSGRRPYWTKGNLYKGQHYNFFNSLVANEAKLFANQHLGQLLIRNERADTESEQCNQPVSVVAKNDVNDVDENIVKIGTMKEKVNDYQVENLSNENDCTIKDKSFNHIIKQVDELDEIYCTNQAQMLTQIINEEESSDANQAEIFDDSKTYSSLQLAFKNPISIQRKKYEDMALGNTNDVDGKNGLNSSKRENDMEKPPLPPKRTKKIETFIGGSMSSINQPDKLSKCFQRSESNLGTTSDSRSLSINLERPQSQIDLTPSKNLPPTPNYTTLPNPKKRSFFSKIFGRKSKTANNSREPSLSPSINKQISSSTKSLQTANSLTKSTGNVSTISSNSIRIPLKVDNMDTLKLTCSNNNTPGMINDNNFMKNDDFNMNFDLTEAEHYALYTTLAPFATQSEFDDMSYYYAPVEGGEIMTTDRT